jgi:hypothetical protein
MTCPSYHIITGEYPPQLGGVSDYTQRICTGLVRAGCNVNVWANGAIEEIEQPIENLFVHRCINGFKPRSLQELGRMLDLFPSPRKILIQYVPHSFGFKAMNLPFAWWLRSRVLRNGDDLRVMFHEVAYPWVTWPIRHNLIAAINEIMVRAIIRVASKIYVSTSAWNPRLIRLGSDESKLATLPIPSNIPESIDSDAVSRIRNQLGGDDRSKKILGHFGTYGQNITRILAPTLERLFSEPQSLKVHFIGRGSETYAKSMLSKFPQLHGKVSAFESEFASEISHHIRACDIMLQPFGDGANTRRTSLMACLQNHRATISTFGHHSESFWKQHHVVRLSGIHDFDSMTSHVCELLADSRERHALGERGFEYYRNNMSLEKSISILRNDL